MYVHIAPQGSSEPPADQDEQATEVSSMTRTQPHPGGGAPPGNSTANLLRVSSERTAPVKYPHSLEDF